MVFEDRFDAGRQLAGRLAKYRNSKNAIVLAIPRGGVEVGYALASALGVPLSVIIAKKVPYPGQPEVAIGAVCNGKVVLDDALVSAHGISSSYIRKETARIKAQIKERYGKFLKGKGFPEVKGKTVIITDDGIATGHTFIAAVGFIRGEKPGKLIAAVPVAPESSLQQLRAEVDELVVIDAPAYFMAVGEFYRDFEQLSDEDVVKYLELANKK